MFTSISRSIQAAVALRYLDDYGNYSRALCRDSVINERWILAATHCAQNDRHQVYNVSAEKLALRKYAIFRQNRNAEKVFVHPLWTGANDMGFHFALLEVRLTTGLRFSRFCIGSRVRLILTVSRCSFLLLRTAEESWYDDEEWRTIADDQKIFLSIY